MNNNKNLYLAFTLRHNADDTPFASVIKIFWCLLFLCPSVHTYCMSFKQDIVLYALANVNTFNNLESFSSPCLSVDLVQSATIGDKSVKPTISGFLTFYLFIYTCSCHMFIELLWHSPTSGPFYWQPKLWKIK